MDLKTALRRIQNGEIDPVYLLNGDDYYLQQFFIKQVEKSFFQEESVDRQLLMPAELSNREILESILKIDLFSSRRLFVLRDAHQIKGPYKKQLVEYCTSPVNNHCLIIIDDDFKSQYALIKEISKIIESVNTARPFESELRKWIKYFFKEQGVQVDNKVIESILTIAGDSVYHAANEVEKICIRLEAGESVTVEKIGQFSGWRRERRQWEFMIAIGNKNLTRAVILGKALLSQGIVLLSLVYQLSTFFQEMLFLKISSGTSMQKSGYIPLSPSVRKRLPAFSQRYTYVEIEQVLKLLGEIDRRIKTSPASDESELTLFLFKVLGANG